MMKKQCEVSGSLNLATRSLLHRSINKKEFTSNIPLTGTFGTVSLRLY